jgi:hypothetical protein
METNTILEFNYYPKEKVEIELRPEILKLVKEFANKKNMSLSEAIERCLKVILHYKNP